VQISLIQTQEEIIYNAHEDEMESFAKEQSDSPALDFNEEEDENISDEENLRSSKNLFTRNINEMTAKLGGSVPEEVAQGLKPSVTNKSKELSQETVNLYQQIL
jgi:hypothetical protein